MARVEKVEGERQKQRDLNDTTLQELAKKQEQKKSGGGTEKTSNGETTTTTV